MPKGHHPVSKSRVYQDSKNLKKRCMQAYLIFSHTININYLFISEIAKIGDSLLSSNTDSTNLPEPNSPYAQNTYLTFSQVSESSALKLHRPKNPVT